MHKATFLKGNIFMSISAENIRNIAIAGHASKGKTTLCEALLNIAGVTERMGKVTDGNTVCDFDAEEKKRKVSINSAVASITYNGKSINFIDTPGLFDFAMGSAEGIRAADTAIITVSARSGLAVGDEKAFKNAGSKGPAFLLRRSGVSRFFPALCTGRGRSPPDRRQPRLPAFPHRDHRMGRSHPNGDRAPKTGPDRRAGVARPRQERGKGKRRSPARLPCPRSGHC